MNKPETNKPEVDFKVVVRQTQVGDFARMIEITRAVYPGSLPWTMTQLSSHLSVFPEGQFVAVNERTGEIVGCAASLIIKWDDYDIGANWRNFTDGGMFTNHDPETGRTLYGAEIMVHPDWQGKGVGKLLYKTRFELAKRLQLNRIRAGARLRNYHKYAEQMSPDDYTLQVVRGKIFDATLSFQLKAGFNVLEVVSDYLKNDPESLGYAAIIEWINLEVAKPRHHLLFENSRFNLTATV
jgi:GNAT superfamily N-acetyltransferase